MNIPAAQKRLFLQDASRGMLRKADPAELRATAARRGAPVADDGTGDEEPADGDADDGDDDDDDGMDAGGGFGDGHRLGST